MYNTLPPSIASPPQTAKEQLTASSTVASQGAALVGYIHSPDDIYLSFIDLAEVVSLISDSPPTLKLLSLLAQSFLNKDGLSPPHDASSDAYPWIHATASTQRYSVSCEVHSLSGAAFTTGRPYVTPASPLSHHFSMLAGSATCPPWDLHGVYLLPVASISGTTKAKTQPTRSIAV